MLTEEEDVDVVICLPPSHCECGSSIKAEPNKKKRHQVHELPIVKPIVTEYHSMLQFLSLQK